MRVWFAVSSPTPKAGATKMQSRTAHDPNLLKIMTEENKDDDKEK